MGVVASGAVAAYALLVAPSARRSRQPVPVLGAAVVAGALLTLAVRRDIPTTLLIAVTGIGLICAVPPSRLPAWLAAAAAVPLAAVAVSDLEALPIWLDVALVVAASAGAVAAANTDELWRATAITPAMFAATAVAVLLAVPDTEEAAVLAGVALPCALLGWPLGLAALGRAGTGAATVLVVWTAGTGGRAEPASVVGAVATLALLVGLWSGRLVARAGRTTPARVHAAIAPVLVIVAHGILAGTAARLGAVHSGLDRVTAVAAILLAVSVYVGTRIEPPRGSAHGPAAGPWRPRRW
jgi:hypothetical protein